MTDVRDRLDRLGLVEYAESFISEGFDTWETLCEVTESDLNDLNVKLGHRRKLQRAIAEERGEARLQQSSGSATSPSVITNNSSHGDSNSNESHHHKSFSTGGQSSTSETRPKRKYRRHPKPDPHAPERPASAYVIFSNHMREQLKGHDLSFTDMAKIVGERWQVLPVEQREQYERQANEAKEKYNGELAEYKKTANHAQYQDYLADFKARNAQQSSGTATATYRRQPQPIDTGIKHDLFTGKRTKLQSELSTETVSSHSSIETYGPRVGSTPVEGTAARAYSSSASSIRALSPPPGKDYFASQVASPESGTSTWYPDYPGGIPHARDRRYSRHAQYSPDQLKPGPADGHQYQTDGASSTPTPHFYSGSSSRVERVQPLFSHDRTSRDYQPSASPISPFPAMMEADTPPAQRVLPSPLPSSHSPAAEHRPPLAQPNPSPSTLQDDPRQSASLAALLRAGEIARQEDASSRYPN